MHWNQRCAAICALSLCQLVIAATSLYGATKPNIIIIEPDDLDPVTMQAALSLGLMPNVRKYIIGPGTYFPHYYVSNSHGCPTRESYLTGLYFKNVGTPQGGHACSAYQFNGHATLAQWLQAAGYTTSLMGKYSDGYGYEDLNGDGVVNEADANYIPPGWNNWLAFPFYSPVVEGTVPPEGQVLGDDNPNEYQYYMTVNGRLSYEGLEPSNYQATVLDNAVVTYLESLPAGNPNPLFLLLTPGAPHVETNYSPHPQPGYGDIFAYDVRPAPQYVGTVNTVLDEKPDFNDPNVSDKPQYIATKPLLDASNITVLTDQWNDRLAALRAVDDIVGSVFTTLQAKGMTNTIVFFLSDNGWMYGDWRLGGKLAPFDPSIGTPLYVNVGGGVTSNAMVIDNDIAATILDLTGATAPYQMDGTSFSPLLSQPTLPWRNRYLAQYFPQGTDGIGIFDITGYSAVRESPVGAFDPDQLYVEYTTGEIEFYDYTVDPFALNNLNDSTLGTRLKQMQQHQAEIQKLLNCSGETCHQIEFQ